MSLSPTSIGGVVFWGVVATMIATVLAAFYRGPIISTARKQARRAPRWLQRVLRGGVDVLHPGWRVTAGGTREQWSMEWRLGAVRAMKRPRFVVVGGIYLDISLSPVDVVDLYSAEFSDLDHVRMRCGGSAFYVTRYLQRVLKQRCHLFSCVGAGDPFSNELGNQLKKQIHDMSLLRPQWAQCAVSIHLLQRDKAFRTTFTSKGALASLEWRPILGKVDRRTKRGGVLYLSGYFRTALCNELCASLRALSPKVLIVLDHGRFRPKDNEKAARALCDAFGERLVDVYICDYAELCQFMALLDVPTGQTNERDALAAFATSGCLPRVTIVRGEPTASTPTAYVLVDGKIIVVDGDQLGPTLRNHPGPSNVFNATLLHALSSTSPGGDLPAVLAAATRDAIQSWAQAAGH